MLKAFRFIVPALILIAVAVLQAQSGGRAKYNFNADWKLFVGDPIGAEKAAFDDSTWKAVTLPRAWNRRCVVPKAFHTSFRFVRQKDLS